jgi:L-lactate dehydrogenase (cytochrome)
MVAAVVDHIYNIADLRAAARTRAHRTVFDYLEGGAGDERAMRNNNHAFSRYDIIHKVLTGIEEPDLSTTLLGERIGVPFILSPSSCNRMFHTQGETAVARAAARVNTIYTLSTLASVSMEEIAALTRQPKWFQLYTSKDHGQVREIVSRARTAGYSALVLTADLAVAGDRQRDLRNGLTIPPRMSPRQVWRALAAPRWTWDYLTKPAIHYANISTSHEGSSLRRLVGQNMDRGFGWTDAERILAEWNGPAVLKGVVCPDDAARAVAIGFRGIVISNHGGRQLDASPAPIDMLQPIRNRIGGDAELIVDGGVRKSTDIVKALALGANAVSFARPYLYGLAAAGEKGVDRALNLFVSGLRRDMILTGAQRIADLNESFIHRRY